MKAFDDLLAVAKTLNSPGGCPWDLEQTFETLRPYVLEEAHEVVDAVDKGDEKELVEELGDLLFTALFYAMIGEREGKFTLEEILTAVREKLIRRHPHVFGEKEANSMEEVIQNWERVKKIEKEERASALDGIPKALSSLQKGEKILKRVRKAGAPKREPGASDRKEILANKILSVVEEAVKEGIDLDSAFREELVTEERHFRAWEEQTKGQLVH